MRKPQTSVAVAEKALLRIPSCLIFYARCNDTEDASRSRAASQYLKVVTIAADSDIQLRSYGGNTNTCLRTNLTTSVECGSRLLLQKHSNGLDPNALYIVWAGANDLFVTLATGGDPSATISAGVANTAAAIHALWAAGARHILVPNVPDLGVTPDAQESGDGLFVTQLCFAYNQVLADAIEELQQAGISIISVDAFTTLRTMVEYRRVFGFTNVTEAYLPAMQGDVRRFLFWDTVHPTTRAHQVLAVVAWVELFERFVLRQGFFVN